MNGHEESYDESRETGARLIAFISPYLFWGTVGVIVGGIVLLQ